MVRRVELEQMSNEIKVMRGILREYAEVKNWTVKDGEFVSKTGPNSARSFLGMSQINPVEDVQGIESSVEKGEAPGRKSLQTWTKFDDVGHT